MTDLNSWLASWHKLRGEFESQSLAHPDVHLCLWHDPDYSVGRAGLRIIDLLQLSKPWIGVNGKGRPAKTKIPRQFVMGIGGIETRGPWTWWLMHQRLASSAQRSRAPNPSIAAELDRVDTVQASFVNLAEHASDLLREMPVEAKIRLSDDVAKLTTALLWIIVLFDIAGLPDVDPTRVVHGLIPGFVPTNCLGHEMWDVYPDLRVLRRNPFCESVAVIDWLTKHANGRNDPKRREKGKSRRIKVSTVPPQVLVDDNSIALSDDEAACLKLVVDAEGEWVSGRSITEHTQVARPDRRLKKVREILGDDDIIEALPAKGTRIRPEWLT